MYVAITGRKGYEQVELKESVRIPGTKKKKEYTVQRLGSLKSLLEKDPEYLDKLRTRLQEEREAAKEAKKKETMTYEPREINTPLDQRPSFAFGHMIVKRMWEMMKLDEFFEKNVTARNKNDVINAIYILLASRLGNPTSIVKTAGKHKQQAGISSVTLDVLYSVLDVLSSFQDELIEHLSSYFKKHTNRNMDTVSYDVTNYYFESTKEGQLRLFGYSKEHRNNEVLVVMGLLIDSNGIPVTMRLFPGNTMDQNTLQDSVDSLQKLYGFEKITIIADRGMNSKENLVFLSDKNHHFIISYTLKKCSTELRNKCLTGNWDYIERADDGEIIYATKVLDTTVSAKVLMSEEEREAIKKERKEQNKKGATPKYKNVEVAAKLHVSYSANRALKDANDRERAIAKAKKKIAEGTAASSLKYGLNKYFLTDNELKITGIDENKIAEEAKWDGYYAVITDNAELTSDQVMELYGTQWKIEECFRILKTDLEARPVRVFKDEHIKGHFVLCYLSLCVIRYIQYLMKTDYKTDMSAQRIMDAIAEPKVLALGTYPKMVMVPQNLSEDFLFLIKNLGFSKLDSEMTITKFRATTKLDLNPQLKELIQ